MVYYAENSMDTPIKNHGSASDGVIRFIVVAYILIYMYIRLKRLHRHTKHITKVVTHTA